MLRGISTLKGLTVGALDGEVGSVHDVYFDDKQWTVRYFVVDTGTWLSGRRVLISPMALRQPADVVGDRLQVGLSKAQIENAPSWDTDKPDGQPRRCVDPSRAREAFGFEATTQLEDGLRRTIDWYLGHRQEAESRVT